VAEKLLTPARAATPAAGVATTYRILRTTEVDGYDEPVPAAAVPEIGARQPPGNAFRGSSRKAAKISLAAAEIESFNDLKALIEDLPADADMVAHVPRITTTATSGRVAKEKRNVKVRAFLYAASREDDNDYHLIIGRGLDASPMYMTIEISGLPRASSRHHARLKAARDAYKEFFGDDLPGQSYDFYDPPIPVEIQGSLFFDMSHATGPHPGPASLRDDIPTIWEIHPISEIVFEP
jgi:hypothetical protein